MTVIHQRCCSARNKSYIVAKWTTPEANLIWLHCYSVWIRFNTRTLTINVIYKQYFKWRVGQIIRLICAMVQMLSNLTWSWWCHHVYVTATLPINGYRNPLPCAGESQRIWIRFVTACIYCQGSQMTARCTTYDRTTTSDQRRVAVAILNIHVDGNASFLVHLISNMSSGMHVLFS